MATIPAILKGDTATAISVTAPEALATLTVKAAGVTRTFTDVAASATLSLAYTADETATMPLGTWPMVFTGVTSAGAVRHYPITAKLKVTDCPGEVYNAPVVVSGGAYIKTQTVGEVGDGSTMKELRQTVNQLARIVSGTATAILAAFVLAAGAASKLEDIPGTNTVYTATETDAAIATAVTAAGSVTPQIATNISSKVTSNVVTKAFVEALGITGGSGGGIDTNAVKDIINAETGGTNTLTHGGLTAIPSELVVPYQGQDYGGSVTVKGSMGRARLTVEAGASDGGTITVEDAVQDGNQAEVTIGTMPVRATVDALSTTQATDHATISAWETYWDGDDVRVTVTNYFGSLDMPSLYIEQNTNTASGGSAVYRTVWDERTRWSSFLTGANGYATVTNHIYQNLADRAWGVYDSSTGEYSPDGLLQISQGEIQIASGLAYQKTVTTGGCAVWVLSATEPTTVSGVTSNGFFRITDGNGDALFEIVKGDKRTVGATASAITAGNGMTITYNVTSDSHPTLRLATDLAGTWYAETECSAFATVSWSGSSGAWVASVTPVGTQPKMFAQASYVTGGETYIRNSAPIGFSNVYIGGTNYTVHVETMNGKKVLVLE